MLFLNAVRALAVALILGSWASTSQAAPKKGVPKAPAKTSQPAKQNGTPPASLDLFSLEELLLGPAASSGAPVRKAPVAPAPDDSLDALLNHSARSDPGARPEPKERMRFPEEKAKAAAAAPEKMEIQAPERVTNEITANALKAASASARQPGKVVAASATVPKLPSKLDLDDDPLAGMPDKDGKRKGASKTSSRPNKRREL